MPGRCVLDSVWAKTMGAGPGSQCVFNFGERPFKFTPPDTSFQPVIAFNGGCRVPCGYGLLRCRAFAPCVAALQVRRQSPNP